MLNTFAFSVENILRSVYAFAALDSFTSRKERPAVLGRDQEPALRQIIRTCAADLVVRLTPAAVASSLAEDADGDLITVDFDIPDSPGLDRQLADVYAHIAKSGFDRLEAVLPIHGYPEPVHPGI